LNFKKLNSHKIVQDDRGVLTAIDGLQSFQTKRFYLIECFKDKWRGEHYHKKCSQLICVLSGRINVKLNEGGKKSEFVMEEGDTYLQLPNCKFAFSSIEDISRIIVLCDMHHDPEEYVFGEPA
jgi:mannose-6-phosphate isomerase-like protein (cupin superfamily)